MPINVSYCLFSLHLTGGARYHAARGWQFSSVLHLWLGTTIVFDHCTYCRLCYGTAPATGNVKMKRVCFRSKRVCFSSANVGVVFSLCLETRRKSPLVPCSVYSWIIHGILKAFPFVIFHMLRLRRKRYSSVRRPGTAYWGSTVQLERTIPIGLQVYEGRIVKQRLP